MSIRVAAVTLTFPEIEVEGFKSFGYGPTTTHSRYLTSSVVCALTHTGKVESFRFVGTRISRAGNLLKDGQMFESIDPALNEVKLCARRIAAPASQRAESGAR